MYTHDVMREGTAKDAIEVVLCWSFTARHVAYP